MQQKSVKKASSDCSLSNAISLAKADLFIPFLVKTLAPWGHPARQEVPAGILPRGH